MPKPGVQIMTPSRSLELPEGYQRFEYYNQGANDNGVFLDPDHDWFMTELLKRQDSLLYLYTHHEVFLDQGIIKHTRSSPNWEGGLVTYATCKHLMRSYKQATWVGKWIVGLCPAKMNNCVMFIGEVKHSFRTNPQLSDHIRQHYPDVYPYKKTDTNPRGDLYIWKRKLQRDGNSYDHRCFNEPPDHTRSVEFYKKSPGSASTRKDGLIPKWWRDLEYVSQSGRRPALFILNPCYLFSKPNLWTNYQPKRATLKLTAGKLALSLSSRA